MLTYSVNMEHIKNAIIYIRLLDFILYYIPSDKILRLCRSQLAKFATFLLTPMERTLVEFSHKVPVFGPFFYKLDEHHTFQGILRVNNLITSHFEVFRIHIIDRICIYLLYQKAFAFNNHTLMSLINVQSLLTVQGDRLSKKNKG